MMAPRLSRGVWAALAILPLAGCASFSSGGGFDTTAQVARERLGREAVWVRNDADRAAVAARTRELLVEPLSADAAVQLALLNSPGLQARFAQLGIAEADYVQATRLPNPGFSFSRTTTGDTLKIDRAVTIGLMNLLALPLAARVESGRFAQARLEAADAMLRHAFATRRAYIEAVAAAQSARYAEQVRDAAQTGALFARDLARAGNVSRLDHAREQAFYAEAATRAARAHEQALSAREALTQRMGLWGAAIDYRLPDRLPDLPGQRPVMDALESRAIGSRLDLQAGRLGLESLARSLGLTRATRFVNVLEVGYLHNSESGAPRETGYEIGIEIPLFDWGGARVARAEAVYLRAANELADAAIAARSQVRDRHAGYQIRYDIARHFRDEVVPLHKRIGDEALLRYNGMLIGVFELLAEARGQIAAVQGYLDALRDFWLAEVGLQEAVGGGAWVRDVEVGDAVASPASDSGVDSGGTALTPGPSPASGRGERKAHGHEHEHEHKQGQH